MIYPNLKPEANKRLRAFFLTSALTKERLKPNTILYHGTSRKFTKFKKTTRNPSTPVDEVNAFFFTNDYHKAVFHARRSAKVNGGSPCIVSAEIAFDKLKDVTNIVKLYKKELTNFGQAKRKAYSEVNTSKWDGIEFRGDTHNDPEYVIFNPDKIKIVNIKELPDIRKRAELVRRKMMQASLANMTLEEFINSPSRNAYIKEFGLKSYYRKGPLAIDGVYYKNILTRANTSNSKRLDNVLTNTRRKSTGNYKKLDQLTLELARKYNFEGVYVESVLNEFLGPKLESYGYKKVNENLGTDNYFKPINNMEASNDQYGYWFTDKGTKLDVEEMRHDDVAASKVIAKDHYKEYVDWTLTYDSADYKRFALQELGWIRVVLSKDLLIEIFPNSVSNNAQRALSQYLRNENSLEKCSLEIIADKYLDFELPRKQSALIAEIRRNIKSHNMEASVTSDSYFSRDAIDLAKLESKSAKSRATLIYMKPSDFLKMADLGNSETKTALIKTLTDKQIKFNQVPQLLFINNGNGTATVTGHEGRHRARYLQSVGDLEMPVVFKSLEAGKGPSIRWGSQDNEFDKVDVWPKTLIGEGKNKSNKIPFPNSIVYPRDVLEASEKRVLVIDENSNIVSDQNEKEIEHWITETSKARISIIQILNDYYVRVYDNDGALVDIEEFRFEETAKEYVRELAFKARRLNITFQIQEAPKTMEAADTRKPVLYNRFSKQPDIPGINLVFAKSGSNIYYKINHNATGKPIVIATSKPLAISLTKLVDYINMSPLKTIDWTIKTGEELAKNYGVDYLRSMLQEFKLAIEANTEAAFRQYLNKFDNITQVETKEDRENKYLAYAKEVARAMASGIKLHEAMKSVPNEYKDIVGKLIAKALPKVVKQLYKSNDPDQQARAVQLALNNVPLKQRISKLPSKDACALYSLAHVTGKSLEELWPIIKPYFGRKNLFGGRGMNLPILSVLIRQLGYTLAVNNEYTNTPTNPQSWGTIKKKVVSESLPYLVVVKDHIIGVANGTIKDTGNTSDNEPVLLAFSLSPTVAKETVVDSKAAMKRLLLQKERELGEIKGGTPQARIQFKEKQKEIVELRNKLREDKNQGVHAYRFRIGAYVEGQVKGYKDRISKVKGILVRENSFKNGGIASGGILIQDEEGNFSSVEATHIKRLFIKPPTALKKQFDKLVERGVIQI